MKIPYLAAPLRRWCAALLLAAGLAGGFAQAQTSLTVPGLPFWEWQAPRPTGFDLTDVHVFDDQSAFAVGDHGTALKTTNQGRTWLPVNMGTAQNIKSVSFISPLVGWVAYNTPPNGQPNNQSGRGELRKTTDGGLTWTVQLIGEASDVEMAKVHFFSATSGYVLYYFNQPGAGRPLRLRFTTDGGQTWTPRPLAFGTNTVQYLTPQVGFTLGSGVVVKTIDGGLTYTNVTPNPAIDYKQVCFVDALNGVVVGGPDGPTPTMYRTTNGGATWTPLGQFGIGMPPYYQFNLASPHSLSFADPLHGTVYGWVTADGGQTWRIGAGVEYSGVNRLRPSGLGFAGGPGGRLTTTTDFGLTTRRLTDSTLTGDFEKIQFTDPVRGWATSTNRYKVARTTDRGTTWQTLDMAATAPGVHWTVAQQLRGAFPDADTAYVMGNAPAQTPPYASDFFLLKTTNGGQSWTRLPYTSSTEMYDIQFRDTRHGLLVGAQGRTWRTQDGGQTWTAGQRATTKNLRTVSWADARTAYAVGDSLAFVRTTDAGLSWQRVNTTFFTTQYAQTLWFHLDNVCFTSPRVGFHVYYGDIFRTADGGLTWTQAAVTASRFYGPYGTGIYGVSFSTPRKGLAYGNEMHQTTDGGLTWSLLANMYTVQALAGAPIDRYNAWVAGRNGSILHYSEKFIQAAPLARAAYCAGETLALAFITTGTFPASEQRFKVELSNARGRFRPGQVRVVGQGTASPLAVVLPATLPPGSAYRLRVVQADSLVLGADNGRDLLITAPVPAATLARLPGGPLQATLPAGTAAPARYEWERNGLPVPGQAGAQLPAPTAGSYRVRACSAGCCGPWSALAVLATAREALEAQVQVWPNPAPAGTGLTVSAPTGARVLLLNALGQVLRPAAVADATGTAHLPTAGLAAGLYVLRVRTAAGIVSRRLVVE